MKLEIDSVEAYLKAISKVGSLVGDFYLDLGTVCKIPEVSPVKFKYGQMKECYKNAYDLCSVHPELIYCEGFSMSIIPMHHAWCITPDGEVVDPTWKEMGGQYIGIPLNRDFVLQQLVETKVWGILSDFIPDVMIKSGPEEFIHPDWLPESDRIEQWKEKINQTKSSRYRGS